MTPSYKQSWMSDRFLYDVSNYKGRPSWHPSCLSDDFSVHSTKCGTESLTSIPVDYFNMATKHAAEDWLQFRPVGKKCLSSRHSIPWRTVIFVHVYVLVNSPHTQTQKLKVYSATGYALRHLMNVFLHRTQTNIYVNFHAKTQMHNLHTGTFKWNMITQINLCICIAIK